MSIYDKASLVLIPSGTKTSKIFSQKPVNGDGDFTFSRSTAATRVNADGNIEKETMNLVPRSNDFSAWSKANNASVTSGQAGYDGTNDAWLLSKPATSFVNINQDVSISGIFTYSVYLKAGTNSTAIIRALGGIDNQFFIDLSNGTSTFASPSIIDYVIEDVGGGWYRTSISVNDSGSVRFLIYPEAPFGNTTAGNIYIQDAQVEQGLVARDYIETTTAAVEGGITDNVPRLDYTDSSCPALLLEPQRTNLLPDSEHFGSGEWSKGNLSVSSNTATSPEGLDNAYEITFTDEFHFLLDGNISVSANTKYTFSFYVKRGTATDLKYRLRDSTNSVDIIAPTSYYSQTSASEWKRIEVTFTTPASCTSLSVYTFSDGGFLGTAYLYGAQLEAGSYATSYIPTYGTSVTRNADDCRITGISDVISSSEYTLFWEGSHIPTGEYNSFATIFNNSAVNQSSRFYRNNTDNQIYAAAFISGSSVTLGSGVTDEYAKCAFRVKSGDFALYVNGSLVASSTSTMTPSATLDSISMQYFYSSQSFYQRTDQFMFFNQALSNEELADLTTI